MMYYKQLYNSELGGGVKISAALDIISNNQHTAKGSGEFWQFFEHIAM